MNSKKLLLAVLGVLFLLGLPIALYVSQTRQEQRSKASTSTTLYLTPSTTSANPLKKKIGETASFDVMIDPGDSLPSFIKLEILFDPTKLSIANVSQISINNNIFTTTEGPVLTSNSIKVAVSIGLDRAKAINEVTSVATLSFKAIAKTDTQPTSITFGNNSQVLSVSSADEANKNVLSTASPGFVAIEPYPRCSDNIDNDSNGFTDASDSSCHTDNNPSNPQSYDPNKDGEHGGNTCADSKDNNGNGLIDGADPVCHTDMNPNNIQSYDPSLPETTPPTPTPQPTVTPLPSSTPKPTAIPTPTPTSAPNATTLSLTVFMHGIGSSGDNANPTESSFSNKNPKTPVRDVTVTLFDANNKLVATEIGKIEYASAAGNFVGNVSLDSSFTKSGIYTIKILTPTHLRRLIPGIQTIEFGKSNILPAVTLVAGDANNDNALNILDYNMVLGCYSDLLPSASCTLSNKALTDFNDDGQVNQFDYNLFLRELVVQNGD